MLGRCSIAYSLVTADCAAPTGHLVLLDWITDHQALLWSLSGASVAIFIASLFIMPALIVRIRPDYFSHEHRPPSRWANRSTTVRTLIIVAKNIIGIVLMIAGLAMLVLPGQGLLTIAVGFFLIDFPGKYRFERWLVSRRPILRPMNWLRRRAGRRPLLTYPRAAPA